MGCMSSLIQVLVAVSSGMQAGTLSFNKILEFLTAGGLTQFDRIMTI